MSSGFYSILSREDALERQGQLIRSAVFLGLEVNYLLWGVQIAQSYYYYKSYRKTDGLWCKASVGILFITEALQSIFTSVFCWRAMVEGLSQLPEQPMAWGGNEIPFMDAFTASVVHFVYAQKIWMLLPPPYNHVCTAIVITLSCLQLGAGLGCTIFMSVINITMSQLGRIRTWLTIWLITAVGNDVLITILMSWRLSAKRTGIKKTDDILTKLIRLIVETGFATAVVQSVCIILYLKWPVKPYNFVLALIGPKVYSNSLLALLNSRKPRMTSETCVSCNTDFKPNIVIRTTRTVDVSSDYPHNESHTLSATSIGTKLVDCTKHETVS